LWQKLFLSLAAFFLFLGVAFGAFGAHALKQKLSPKCSKCLTSAYGTKCTTHLHCSLLPGRYIRGTSPARQTSGWWFIAGIILFSGSLYTLALSDIMWLGAVTPFGGLSFLIGWLWLAWSVWKSIQ